MPVVLLSARSVEAFIARSGLPEGVPARLFGFAGRPGVPSKVLGFPNRAGSEVKSNVGENTQFNSQNNSNLNFSKNDKLHFLNLDKDGRIRILKSIYGLNHSEAEHADSFLMPGFKEAAQPEVDDDPHGHSEIVEVALKLPEPGEITRYVDRPEAERDMDPVTYLRTYWGRYMDAGILYQDDLSGAGGRDPQLVPNIRSYCQRMAIRHPDRKDEFVARDFLPPPRKARLDKAVAADPSGLAKRYLDDRRARIARHSQRRRERHPS